MGRLVRPFEKDTLLFARRGNQQIVAGRLADQNTALAGEIGDQWWRREISGRCRRGVVIDLLAIHQGHEFRSVPDHLLGRLFHRGKIAQGFMLGDQLALVQSLRPEATATDAVGEAQQKARRIRRFSPDGDNAPGDATRASEPNIAFAWHRV